MVTLFFEVNSLYAFFANIFIIYTHERRYTNGEPQNSNCR